LALSAVSPTGVSGGPVAQSVHRTLALLSVAGVVVIAGQPAQAAVSKDYARETWDNSKC